MEELGEEMTLQQALIEASRVADIPRDVLVEIQETLGPVAMNGDLPEATGGIAEQPSEYVPPIELENIEPLQVLTYIEAATEGERGWVASGKKNDKSFRARTRDDIGLENNQLGNILLGLEQENYIELARRYTQNKKPIIENARLTEAGESAINRARTEMPEVVAEAEARTKQRFVWQVQDMRHEACHEAVCCGLDFDSVEKLAGTESGRPNPMTADLGAIGLKEIARLPKDLGAVQRELVDRINKKKG
jgi:hypothetical protein